VTPIENAVHLCIDMRRIFAKGGIWETDVYVLSTVLDAVNLGFRVAIVEDALLN
jgi:hypothetical protein